MPNLNRLPRTGFAFNAWCIIASFGTYFCMYAFRKPFTAGKWEGTLDLPGLPPLDEKIVLVIAQVFGYALSKVAGIKIVSELPAGRRAAGIVALIGLAEAALLLLPVVPRSFRPACLFLNGIPLGMVWGLVFGYLEGRRTTEILAAGLSASYIVASGAVKSVGRWMLAVGIPEPWMPAASGALFIPLMLGCVWMLSAIPKPDAADEKARVKRQPMNANDRRRFFMQLAPGLVVLTLLYIVLTAYRDFRDNFAREIWDALGYGGQPEIFTLSELPVAAGVLVALALLAAVKDNRKALVAMHALMLTGTALIGGATWLFTRGSIGGAAWMITVGFGMYLAYVPFGSALFDRVIAVTGFAGTAGFMIYVTDASGYLGSVGLLLFKNLGRADLPWLEFFIGFSWITAIGCTIAFAVSLIYFLRRHPPGRSPRSAVRSR